MTRALYTAPLLAALAMLCSVATFAQTPGMCAPAKAEAYLDVGNVRARILNNGNLFWRGSPHIYEVPKGGKAQAIFTSGIWIGGRVGSEVRVAAARYGNFNFWAGPLDDDGNPPDHCLRYDHIYEITRNDLITYAQTGEPTPNLLDWPWHLGAPVIDGDGIEGNYNLVGGDRPALIGDQMLWWVMNDAGGPHLSPSSDTLPIGMEVHGSAFAFQRPRSPINNVTFYRYVLHYKGREPLKDTYFGIYADPDLGNFDDDYIGSDSLLHLGYVYNADDFDEGGDGYGQAPPAVGYTFLKTAFAPPDHRDNDRDGAIDEPGEMHGLTSFMTMYGGGCIYCEPGTGEHYYLHMQSRWKNGASITLGGSGYDFSDIPTKFFFPGDPVTQGFWTEFNRDNQGTPTLPSDRRFVVSTGPFDMASGAVQEILFAIVWARGENHLDSITQLKKDTARLQDIAQDILVPDAITGLPDAPASNPPDPLGFAQNYPNPFSAGTTIRYSVPREMMIRLTVYDVLGRRVKVLVDEQQQPGAYTVAFDGAGLPAGIYVYRIEMDHLLFTRRMMLVP